MSGKPSEARLPCGIQPVHPIPPMDLVSDPSRSYRAPLLPLLTPGLSARQRDAPPLVASLELQGFGGRWLGEPESGSGTPAQHHLLKAPMRNVSRYLDARRWWINLAR